MPELLRNSSDDKASIPSSHVSNATAKGIETTQTNTSYSSKDAEQIIADKEEGLDKREAKDVESGVKTEPPVLSGKKMFGVMVALALSMFLAALDNTIVSTMLPKITEKFHALTLMTWIISSYVVASTALQPIYGKLCHIYGHQYVLLVAHAFFLAGSVVCGASKSAHMLIAGRTIAGVGGSGLMSICFVVVGDFIPTARSPLYLSVFGMMWAIASVVGPLLGGVFADKTGFEWGFYINPCIQGAVVVLIVLFMRIPRPQGSATSKLKRIDFIGIFAIVAGIVLLELALTWGGQDHPWKSAAVIVPLILGILILGVFVLIEWKISKEPVMPLRLFKRRNTRLMFVAQIFFGMSFFLPIFYFPLYLSVAKNSSAISSGLHLISCVLALSLASITSGVLISKTGVYLPIIWIGLALNTTGIGLFALIGSHSSNGVLIGIPIVFGIGTGLSLQPMLFCAQNSVDQQDIATTTTLFMTIRMLGNAIGLAIAQSVLQNEISPLLKAIAAQFPDQANVVFGIVSDQSVIWKSDVPEDVRSSVIDAYVKSLQKVYLVFLAFGGLTFIVSLFAKNLKLRRNLGGAAAE